MNLRFFLYLGEKLAVYWLLLTSLFWRPFSAVAVLLHCVKPSQVSPMLLVLVLVFEYIYGQRSTLEVIFASAVVILRCVPQLRFPETSRPYLFEQGIPFKPIQQDNVRFEVLTDAAFVEATQFWSHHYPASHPMIASMYGTHGKALSEELETLGKVLFEAHPRHSLSMFARDVSTGHIVACLFVEDAAFELNDPLLNLIDLVSNVAPLRLIVFWMGSLFFPITFAPTLNLESHLSRLRKRFQSKASVDRKMLNVRWLGVDEEAQDSQAVARQVIKLFQSRAKELGYSCAFTLCTNMASRKMFCDTLNWSQGEKLPFSRIDPKFAKIDDESAAVTLCSTIFKLSFEELAEKYVRLSNAADRESIYRMFSGHATYESSATGECEGIEQIKDMMESFFAKYSNVHWEILDGFKLRGLGRVQFKFVMTTGGGISRRGVETISFNSRGKITEVIVDVTEHV